MTRIEARKIIRKATGIIIDRFYENFGSEKVEASNTFFDVQRVLFAMRGSAGNPNYDRMQAYMPTTIPFDLFNEAMKTLTDKMLTTGISMGMADRGLK